MSKDQFFEDHTEMGVEISSSHQLLPVKRRTNRGMAIAGSFSVEESDRRLYSMIKEGSWIFPFSFYTSSYRTTKDGTGNSESRSPSQLFE